jgi:MFS family permease
VAFNRRSIRDAAGAVRSTYGFLWRDRHVLEFLGASVGGRLCFSMLPLGIVLFSRDVSGSIAVAGAAAGAFGLTSAALAPARGHLVDRLGWPALAGFSIAFGAALGLYIAVGLSVGTTAALVGLAAAAGALAPPIGPAARDVWGMTFREREPELHALYAADTTLEEGTFIGGPLLVGAIVAIASSEAAVGAAAVGIVVLGVATGVSTFGRMLGARHSSTDAGLRGKSVSPRLLLLLGSFVGPGAALGCLEVSVPAFAGEHGSVAWAGPLLAVVSAGSMLGGFWYGTRRSKGSREGRYLTAVGLFAILLVPSVFAPSLAALAALLVLPGLVLGPLFILLYELVDRAAPTAHRTGAFSLVVAINNGSVALGAAAAGAAIAALNPWAGFALASAAAALGALGALWLAAAGGRQERT